MKDIKSTFLQEKCLGCDVYFNHWLRVRLQRDLFENLGMDYIASWMDQDSYILICVRN